MEHLLSAHILTVLLLWVMKGLYIGFGSAQQKVDMHARSKNTFIVLKYAYFYAHNCQTINFSKPLLCSTLNCSDWSIVIDLLHATDVNNGTPITISEP